MKKIALSLMTLLLATTVFAQPRSQLTSKNMMKIDLVGMQILNSKGQNAFPYEIKLVEEFTDELGAFFKTKMAENEELASSAFELDQESRFENIYVFVAYNVKHKEFVLYQIFVNQNGTAYAVDYDITKATRTKLTLQNGPSHDLQTFTLTTGRDLFSGRGGPF